MRGRLATFAKAAGQPGRGPGLRVVRAAADAPAPGAELYLYDEIGFWGVTASDVVSALAPLTGTRVTLRVNSPGGEVFDGIAIYNLLRNHPGGVDVVVDGLAASAASFIAMAGETVTMQPHSRMMIHDALAFAYGNAADLLELAAILDDLSGNIAEMYAERAGRPADEFRELMRAETWLTPAGAVDLGLADAAAADPDVEEDPDAADAAAGDDEDAAAADLMDRWKTSIAALAAANTRARAAAPAPAPSTTTGRRTVTPAAAAPAVDVNDIRSILKGLPR